MGHQLIKQKEYAMHLDRVLFGMMTKTTVSGKHRHVVFFRIITHGTIRNR